MDEAKKYCETFVHEFMRGTAIPPYEGKGDLVDVDELKMYVQKVIRDNNYLVNFDGVSILYLNLEKLFEPDVLETVCCLRVFCCLPFWRKREYEKHKAQRPWALKVVLRKSNVNPTSFLGRNSGLHTPLSPQNEETT